MSEFNGSAVSMSDTNYGAYVGLDVHKDSISVAVASPGRGEPEQRGEIANKPKTIARLAERLCAEFGGQCLLFCYEAGPCGFTIHRQLSDLGFECQVIAPSRIPKQAGDRIKTDRRDASKLARYLRSGDLTAVWVPDLDQEAIRDLCRARCDMKQQELKARQQLSAFVLRHGHHWGKTRWTKMHYNWLESLGFNHPLQHTVLQDYVDAVKAAGRRVSELTQQIDEALQHWSLAPVVYSLMALRGVDQLSAVVLLSELGDIRRFASPKQLMSYLGLVPSEHSSGGRRYQGAITRTGNGHARRILVESAWCYRFQARQTMHLKRKASKASETAMATAWRAQKRLCTRYRRLIEAGKNQKVVCVAIARELIAYVWEVVCSELDTLPTTA